MKLAPWTLKPQCGLHEPESKTVGNVLRWLPMTGSVTLMLMISLLAGVSFSQLRASSSWRKHSYEVLEAAETLLSDLFSIQGEARDYVFTGQGADLKTFQESADTQQVTQLK